MTGCQRIMAAMVGRWPDRVPVMLHDFLMAARQSGVTMAQFRSDPAVMSRCFIEAVERHGHDGMLVDMDTSTVAGAMGAPVTIPDDSPAVVHGALLTEWAQVSDLLALGLAPGLAWIHVVQLIGLSVRQMTGYCLLERGLRLMSWHRDEPLTVRNVLRTFTAPPSNGGLFALSRSPRAVPATRSLRSFHEPM
ncbi:MAG: hypothetical protein IT445_12895 [Phycisphaeraceae bacterium]|nr:hypothetical protein [Phycisphaeraceae bacterium]